MRVAVSSVLADYTGGAREIEAEGRTVAALLADLDRRHPGIRFRIIDEQDRIRPHMRIWVDDHWVEDLREPIPKKAAVQIFHAISGG